jgi:hypothetical protein
MCSFFSFHSSDKGNLEDTLAFGVSLALNLSLMLGLCLITDFPETPDNLFDPDPVFPVEYVGIVLIAINVLPFLYFFYASAIIVKHGPLVGMRFGASASTPEHQKAQIQENIQCQRPGRFQRNLSLAHVKKVVDTDKVEKLKRHTAAHRTAAIQKIQAREKKADARVRQRLRDRRIQKLKNEQKSEHSTKVVPVATAPPNSKKYDPTFNAARVPVSVAIAAAVSSTPVETMAQKDIDAVRQSIHDKIGTVQKLQIIFGKLDQDKTLTLSPPEFKRLIGSVVRPPPTKMVFKAIWRDVCQLRKSGDGEKEIDFETFKAWLEF